jgi:hypothetical protein
MCDGNFFISGVRIFFKLLTTYVSSFDEEKSFSIALMKYSNMRKVKFQWIFAG